MQVSEHYLTVRIYAHTCLISCHKFQQTIYQNSFYTRKRQIDKEGERKKEEVGREMQWMTVIHFVVVDTCMYSRAAITIALSTALTKRYVVNSVSYCDYTIHNGTQL